VVRTGVSSYGLPHGQPERSSSIAGTRFGRERRDDPAQRSARARRPPWPPAARASRRRGRRTGRSRSWPSPRGSRSCSRASRPGGRLDAARRGVGKAKRPRRGGLVRAIQSHTRA